MVIILLKEWRPVLELRSRNSMDIILIFGSSISKIFLPVVMSSEDWEKFDRKARSTIHLCLLDSILLNVSGEDFAKKLWEKLGNLYQSKSLVNKFFVQKKLYHLRMEDGDSVTDNLNVFNTLVS